MARARSGVVRAAANLGPFQDGSWIAQTGPPLGQVLPGLGIPR